MGTAPISGDDDSAFFEALLDDPPERLMLPAEDGSPGVNFAFGDARRKECRIWHGYVDASCFLLNRVLEGGAFSQNLIFPAMFNLRHALEVALKWHIRYAGGIVPKNAGHNLEILIDAFQQTAHDLDEDVTYISEYMLDLISEIASIDPRSITFRYSTELDGSPITISEESWDLRRLCFTASYLAIWFDHLSGYIDMSSEEYQTMLREVECR